MDRSKPGRNTWQMCMDVHGINSYLGQLVPEVNLSAYTIKGAYKTKWSYSMVKPASLIGCPPKFVGRELKLLLLKGSLSWNTLISDPNFGRSFPLPKLGMEAFHLYPN